MQAEFIRSVCPDFRWLNRNNKQAVKTIYQQELQRATQEIETLHAQKREVSNQYTNWNLHWALEFLHEGLDENIKNWQRLAKRCGFILNLLKHRRTKDGKITDADIARAKEVPIDTLYEGRLRPVAGRLSGLCPFHQERTPSFTIYQAQNSWWCYGCSQGGDVIDFVMRLRDCEFLKAVRFLL